MKKIIATTTLALLGITGCAGVNHDTPNPSEDIQTRWVRIETPPSFITLMFTCIGKTGIYMDQSEANVNVITGDSLCPVSNVFNPAIQRKYDFRIVVRTNSNNAGTS